MELLEIYNKILLSESAKIDDVRYAIKNRFKCRIYYDGDDPGGKGERIIEPVALGYSLKDLLVVRAWEDVGVSHSKITKNNPVPGWRLFRLDKIFTFHILNTKFNTKRPNYNPNGDKGMKRIIQNLNFNIK